MSNVKSNRSGLRNQGSNRTGGVRGLLLRKLDTILERLGNGEAQSRPFSMEGLEPRTFLSATLAADGDFTLYDSTAADPNDVNVVLLNDTNGATVTVTT